MDGWPGPGIGLVWVRGPGLGCAWTSRVSPLPSSAFSPGPWAASPDSADDPADLFRELSPAMHLRAQPSPCPAPPASVGPVPLPHSRSLALPTLPGSLGAPHPLLAAAGCICGSSSAASLTSCAVLQAPETTLGCLHPVGRALAAVPLPCNRRLRPRVPCAWKSQRALCLSLLRAWYLRSPQRLGPWPVAGAALSG